jgi:hypothetical protein
MIRICASTLGDEYLRIHGKPEPAQAKLTPAKLKAREVLTTINLIHPLIFKRKKGISISAWNGNVKTVSKYFVIMKYLTEYVCV